MRRTLSIITLFAILLTACVGDPGPPGFDGQDGGLIVADAFEITMLILHPETTSKKPLKGLTFIESDVALVYILWVSR